MTKEEMLEEAGRVADALRMKGFGDVHVEEPESPGAPVSITYTGYTGNDGDEFVLELMPL